MFSFDLDPVEVDEGEKKPFEVYIENNLVYSNLTPTNCENGPVLFSHSKWYGEPVPEHLERIENAVENAVENAIDNA
jgi:hypothetical protein